MNPSTHSSFRESQHDFYEYVSSSLNFVEAKNGSLVAFDIALLIGLLQPLQYPWFSSDPFLLAGLLISFIPLIVSLLLALWSFFPKSSSKDQPKTLTDDERKKYREEIYSTEHITALGYDELKTFLQSRHTGEPITEADEAFIRCIFHKAAVSSRKYKRFRLALKWACGSVIAITTVITIAITITIISYIILNF